MRDTGVGVEVRIDRTARANVVIELSMEEAEVVLLIVEVRAGWWGGRGSKRIVSEDYSGMASEN